MAKLPFDEETVFDGSGLALRRQAIEDEIEQLEILLNRLDHTEYHRMVEIVDQIEDLQATLDAIEGQMATEKRLSL